MKILIETTVEQDFKTVFDGFNESLFLALKPPFPPMALKRFDGSQTGDKVEMQLNFILFKQDWNAEIIAHGATDTEYYFIDSGVQLPFFLKYWRHRHRIIKTPKNQTLIIDDIEFTTPFGLLNYLMYPVMYLQFAMRKPVYKRIFKK